MTMEVAMALCLGASAVVPSPAGAPVWAERGERMASADTLEGRVMGRGGETPVAGAELRLVSRGEAETRRSRSDSAGRYVFFDLPAGRYEMRVSADGFEPLEVVITLPDRGRFQVDLWLDAAERIRRGGTT